jgi:hypothetical protein
MSDLRARLVREELEPRPSDHFLPLVERFRDYLDARNRSDRTVKNYILLIRRYLNHNNDLEPFERRHVDSFPAKLKRDGSSGLNQRWAYYVIGRFFKAHGRTWPFDRSEVPKAQENDDVPVIREDDMEAMETTAKERKERSKF